MARSPASKNKKKSISPTSNEKSKPISSYFIKSPPNNKAVDLANKTASAVAKSLTASFSASSSLNSLKIESQNSCDGQSKLFQSPQKKKIKLSASADDSDLFNDDLLEILVTYDSTSHEKTSKLKQNGIAKVNGEQKEQHAAKNLIKENKFPSYLFCVVGVETCENENSHIHLRLKKVDSSFKSTKKSKDEEEVEKNSFADGDPSVISCFLYDSW
jgi:hypothetical protein